MDSIKSAVDIVKDVGPTVRRYVKYQFCPKDYVDQFVAVQNDLGRQPGDVEAKLNTQLSQPGKKATRQVDNWREEVRKETAVKVEDLTCKGGCFTYICSSRKLDKKTQALKEGICRQGENYTNIDGQSLVIDDHSVEYCKTTFKEKQEQLKLRLKDIEAILEPQRMQPGKIARKEVEDWKEKACDQIAIKVEDLISRGECSSSSNFEKKIEELKQTFERGEKYTNASESLVVDDHSMEYRALVFKGEQGSLKQQKELIEANLKTQCKQPRKIARKDVKKWLEKAGQQIAIEVEDLISQGECSSSTNLKKNTEELKQMLEEGKGFTNAGVSLVIDDRSIKGVPLLVEECRGRDDIQDQILEWLKGDEVTRIAVWGMGGVGKTTIMKQVHNQLLKESKFNKVVWVKVSRDFDITVQQKKKFDILKFQKRIASSLELKLEPEDHENENKLAELISQKLRLGNSVLILDDVWQQFCLEDVGIPNLDENNGCKLVLTTRLQDVARAMECEVISVNPLPPEEALALFLEKVGRAVLSDGRIKEDIDPYLKQILQICDGLPLAIVTIAKTVRGKLDPRSWKSALNEWSKSKVITDRLKFSYECLEPQCQECFLYYALYPENYKIRKEELIECWIDEGIIYEEGDTREAMNCKGHDILDKLVDNCLLEGVKNIDRKDCVRMYYLFREMALDMRPQFLVKAGMDLKKLPEEHEWRENLLKVSLMENHITEIPSSMSSPKCPMLTTLLLSNNIISTISEAFFEHMLGLKVLDLSNNPELSRLPSSVSKLEKLTTLLLGGCSSLREVPCLSNLRGLKRLNLSETPIEELPQGLESLTKFKRFKIFGCNKIKKLFPLRLLQYLENVETIEVGLCQQMEEIISFSHEEGEEAPEKLTLSKLERLKFHGLPALKCIYTGSSILMCNSIKSIEIGHCENIVSVFSSVFIPLLTLKYLRLQYLGNLKLVFNEEALGLLTPQPPTHTTFFSLKTISVSWCPKLKNLFSSVRLLDNFQFLETIEVQSCYQMEELISSPYEEEKEAPAKVTLPKLERVTLCNLPEYKSISSSSSVLIV